MSKKCALISLVLTIVGIVLTILASKYYYSAKIGPISAGVIGIGGQGGPGIVGIGSGNSPGIVGIAPTNVIEKHNK